jgi:hypothetical protein
MPSGKKTLAATRILWLENKVKEQEAEIRRLHAENAELRESQPQARSRGGL